MSHRSPEDRQPTDKEMLDMIMDSPFLGERDPGNPEEEVSVIIASPLGDHPVPGTVTGYHCGECGIELALSPSSQKAIAEHEGLGLLCMGCMHARGNPNAEMAILPGASEEMGIAQSIFEEAFGTTLRIPEEWLDATELERLVPRPSRRQRLKAFLARCGTMYYSQRDKD